MCSADSFKRKGKVEEELYFQKISQQQLKEFSERVHKAELRSLLELLPENHGLSSETLHDLLVWKHTSFEP